MCFWKKLCFKGKSGGGEAEAQQAFHAEKYWPKTEKSSWKVEKLQILLLKNSD